MYKILIADDEDIIRRGLAGMVSQHPKLEVAALAEDGEIALEQAAKTRPDLTLVDINMPFVDGFAFIKEAKQLLPDAEIIIVTGYDDFAFAQKALQLGVADYLLKPIMEEPFFAVLDKAISRLDDRATSRRYMDWLTQQLERNRPSLLNDFFRRWLRGSMDRLEIEDRMKYLDIQIPLPYWVTVLHLRNDPSQKASITDWEPELLLYGCDNIVQEVFAPYCPVLTFQTEDSALAMISEVLPQDRWEKLAHELVTPIEGHLLLKVELVQRKGVSLSEFPEVVEQAMQEYKAHQRYSDMVTEAIRIIDRRWGNSDFSLQAAADALYVTPQ